MVVKAKNFTFREKIRLRDKKNNRKNSKKATKYAPILKKKSKKNPIYFQKTVKN